MLGKLEPRTVDRGQTGFCTEPDERERVINSKMAKNLKHKLKSWLVHSVSTERRSVLSGTAPKCVLSGIVFHCHHRYVVINYYS